MLNTQFTHLLRRPKRSALLVLGLLTFGFSSCEKDVVEDLPSTSAEDVTLKKILALGFSEQNIQDKGTYYLVEGDIRFDKQAPVPVAIAKSGVITDVVQSQDQVHGNQFISYNKQPFITIRMHSSCPSEWTDEVMQSIADWNSVPGCRADLAFTTSSTADITICGTEFTESNGSITYGEAYLPLNGNPGHSISISKTNSRIDGRRATITHELGHTLGFGHTNKTSGYTVIAGTPVSDPNSVMNDGNAPNRQLPWQGFSQFDVVGVQNLYPVMYGDGAVKIIARHSGKTLNVYQRSLNDNAAVYQHQYLGGANEQWLLQDVGGGYVKIVARHSGKVLDITASSMNDNTPVVQHEYLGGTNQQWKLQSVGNNYHTITARHSGKALDVSAASLNDNATVTQHTYLGVTNQHWKLDGI